MHGELKGQTEMIAMFILQHKECHIDHSLQIIKTLNKVTTLKDTTVVRAAQRPSKKAASRPYLYS